MYADTLFDIERGHLLRLCIWAGASILVGVLLLGIQYLRKGEAPFLRHFAIQMLGWGAVDLALAGWGLKGLAFRDYAAATRLKEFLWLNVGLDVGYVGIGITLALAGWILAKRLGLLGAGVGVVVQGFALFVLDLRILTVIDSARVALLTPGSSGWLWG